MPGTGFIEVIVCVVFGFGPAHSKHPHRHHDWTFTWGGKTQGASTDTSHLGMASQGSDKAPD